VRLLFILNLNLYGTTPGTMGFVFASYNSGVIVIAPFVDGGDGDDDDDGDD
jgi:hypothetical protein